MATKEVASVRMPAPARMPAGRSEPWQYHAEEFARPHGVHRDGTFVLREFERGALTVLFPLDSHRALAQEEQLDRWLLPGRKGRARVEANESEPRIPLGEGAEPLGVHALGVDRHPVVSRGVHDNDVVIARLAVDRFFAGRFLVASLRAILIVALTIFIDPGEDTVLERTFLGECSIGGLSLRDAQKALPAGTAKLTHHHLEAFGTILRAVMDALGEVSDRALFHHDAFGDRIAAFEHITNLIKRVTMTGRCPTPAPGAADVQEIVVRRVVLARQKKSLVQHAIAHAANPTARCSCDFANSHGVLLSSNFHYELLLISRSSRTLGDATCLP